MNFFLNALYTLGGFLVALGLLVTIHEFGHYWVARRCNIKVLRFSLGFGKPLFTWTRGADRTEWVLAAVPFGGYVKMLDEREGPVAPEEAYRAFNRQSVWKRIAVVLAGPLANLLLAIVLYWGLFMVGMPGVRPVLGSAPQATAAAQAGVASGDVLTAVGDEPVTTWQDTRWALLKRAIPAGTVALQVNGMDGAVRTLTLDMSTLSPSDLNGDFMRSLGITRLPVDGTPLIAEVKKGGAAERAGLQAGDEIAGIDNAPMASMEQAIAVIRAHAGRPMVMELQRGSAPRLYVTVTPDAVKQPDGTTAGILNALLQPPEAALKAYSDKYRIVLRHGPLDALAMAFAKTWDLSTFSLQMMGRMITGQVSLKNLSGPITIADYAGQTAQMGWIPYLVFIALVSISLGVLNLLPIPLLDGGHLLYYIVEIFKGSPVSERVMEFGQRVGIGVLGLMMVIALYNDVVRQISG